MKTKNYKNKINYFFFIENSDLLFGTVGWKVFYENRYYDFVHLMSWFRLETLELTKTKTKPCKLKKKTIELYCDEKNLKS